MNNPVRFIDPNGCDTVNISFNDGKWNIDTPIITDGDDIFNVTVDGNTTSYTFHEGESGERVDALNLEINDQYTLGVYHISGAGSEGTGYYVTPGRQPSCIEGSGARIPEGVYPILKPGAGQWKQPQIGGSVANRGIRVHYGYPDPRIWTEGCFVISSDYYKENGKIKYTKENSLKAMSNFDNCLGGGPLYQYTFTTSNGKTKSRFGSRFSSQIKHKFILKSR